MKLDEEQRQEILERLQDRGIDVAPLLAGEIIRENRRQEIAFNTPTPTRNKKKYIKRAADYVIMKPEARIKVWPMIGLAAITNKKAGAYRIYELMRHVDKIGQGWIYGADLRDKCDELGVHVRNRQRWIKQAEDCGLVEKVGKKYYYISLGRAAHILGAGTVGKYAHIHKSKFVKTGWRGHVWSAFLSK